MMVREFLLLFVLFLSFQALSAHATSRNETDYHALLELKAKIVDDPQNVMRSWNDSVHFCNWEGVVCGRRHRRVTVLDLRSKGLVGSLSPYIGNMSFLREIWLQNNTLKGEIPSELGHLFRLQVLHLGNNSFQGQIPSNLSYCSNLTILRASFNKLVGNLPIELATLSKLKQLSIDDNYFSGSIPPFIGNFTYLERLSARKNFFIGSIPDALGKLKYLSFLGLGTNNLSGIIPPSIYNISTISTFSVSENQLHGTLPSNIGTLMPNLQFLQVWGNHFSGSIPESLSNASKLYYIELAINNFTGTVSPLFGGLRQLNFFNLYGNSLGNGARDDLNFLNSLVNSSNLALLDLSINSFGGELPNFAAANLSSSILAWLSIDENPIHGSLPPWLSSLVSLSFFSIQFTQITGYIPTGIGKLENLERLYLNDNRLSGTIPLSIGNLSSLTELYINDNDLHGTIPSRLGNCHNLLFMDLSQNNLDGSIPNQLFDKSNVLVSLDLSQNHLVGSLPSEIGNLFSLSNLKVSKNRLSGNIPHDLSRCSSLEFLNMDDNNFQGTIPSSFQSLKGLIQLDLSNNNLSGEIPNFLETFALKYLNLSFNNFEGQVPMKGVFANSSAISIQGNNNLCGGPPELKLPRCVNQAISKRNTSRLVKIVVIAISCVSVITILLVFLYCMFRKNKTQQNIAFLQVRSFPELSYARILKATNGFSSENLIGVGSFGSVYKGILDHHDQDGRAIVAIKVLNLQRRGASKSFMAECQALRNIRHRNLVKIITSCSSIDFQGNDFKALVYEFMPKGNLEKWLHPDSDINATVKTIEYQSLNMLQRINIAIDVGNALEYLHHHCQDSVIHCDVKPSNILLDENMLAHVGDFGLAKFLPELTSPNQSSSVGVKGTIGYSAPEYGIGGQVSTSGDVYSYGILLLEMMTRKKPTNDIFVDGLNLHNFCGMAMPNQVLDVVDIILLQEVMENKNPGSVGDSIDNNELGCIISIIKVGIACSMESPADRIDISNAVTELQSIRKKYLQA